MNLASVALGLNALRGNMMRTVLSTLGVMIGVGALVAILSVTDGLERFSREQIERTTDLQLIQIMPVTTETVDGVRIQREVVPQFHPSDLEILNGRLAESASATLVVQGSSRLSLPGDTAKIPTLMIGTLTPCRQVFDLTVEHGRWLQDEQDPLASVVLSATAAERLGVRGGPGSLVGRRVRLLDRELTVIGIVREPSSQTTPRAFVLYHDELLTLLSGFERRTAMAMVKVARVEESEAVRRTVEEWLRERYGAIEGNFMVSSSRQRIAQVSQAMLVFKLVMGAIAGISLIVGGIGIMNILLASVSERTREIGIRRATGARARDILVQFLAESVAITGVGSLLGVALGLSGSVVVTAVIRHLTTAPLVASFTWTSIFVAVGSAVLIGLAFGIYPALRAAKLDPVEAIRYE
jgi:putative ABC transport system permease protein